VLAKKLNIAHIALATEHVQKWTKTYNSGYSLVVTELTTNPPLSGLTMGEQTGFLAL
jgi:hypothetical protein